MSKRRLTVPAGLAVVVLAATGAYAAIPDSTGVINGCYQKNEGILRVVDTSSQACRDSEIPISWSQNGKDGRAGDLEREASDEVLATVPLDDGWRVSVQQDEDEDFTVIAWVLCATVSA